MDIVAGGHSRGWISPLVDLVTLCIVTVGYARWLRSMLLWGPTLCRYGGAGVCRYAALVSPLCRYGFAAVVSKTIYDTLCIEN